MHVQFEPAAPVDVLHSELRSHEHADTTRPDATTVPTHLPLHEALPAGHDPPDLSLQKSVSMRPVITSSRQSVGIVQTVWLPEPGPVMLGIVMLAHAGPGAGDEDEGGHAASVTLATMAKEAVKETGEEVINVRPTKPKERLPS